MVTVWLTRPAARTPVVGCASTVSVGTRRHACTTVVRWGLGPRRAGPGPGGLPGCGYGSRMGIALCAVSTQLTSRRTLDLCRLGSYLCCAGRSDAAAAPHALRH